MTTEITSIETYQEKAETFRKRGNWPEALAVQRQIQTLAPNNWQNYVSMGDTLLDLKEWKAAIKAYRKSLELREKFDWVWHNLAVAYGKLEQWDEVERCHLKLRSLNPNFWEMHQSSFPVAEHINAFLAHKEAASLESLYGTAEQARIETETQTTSLMVAIGSKSQDDVAIVGRNGFIFLFGGSNHVARMYQTEDTGTSDSWTALINQRIQNMQRLNVRFLQVMIPEKSTALPEYYPFFVRSPSPVYQNIKRSFKRDYKPNATLPAPKLCFFEDHISTDKQEKLRLFRKNDSHLTSYGASVLFSAQMKALNERVSYDLLKQSTMLHEGDLGCKFSTPFFEEIEIFDEIAIAGKSVVPSLIKEQISSSRQTDSIRVYTNAVAPIKKKVIAFANSFFWSSGTSLGQAWWFSRFFEEFHFIWSPKIDYNYIDQHQPDIVIAQTIERFLNTVPPE